MKAEKGDLKMVGENKSENQTVRYLGTEVKMPEWLSRAADVCEMAHYVSSRIWLTCTMPSTLQHFCAIAVFQEIKQETCYSLCKNEHGFADIFCTDNIVLLSYG